jgi:putative molybdopterin biosynthesis protein
MANPLKKLMSTKEVARYLGVNEKMVYGLISDKGLPGTKITGKWLFPSDLVDQWVDAHTVNHPEASRSLAGEGLLVIAGSNDILLERTVALFNRLHPDYVAVLGNLGSLGGLRALRRGLCHLASSHLLQEDGRDYNFGFAEDELGEMPAVVGFCRRRQGLLVAKGNPRQILGVSDLSRPEIRIVNRPLGTGTRLLLDMELEKAGIRGDAVKGYDREVGRHLDVGLEVLSGRADVGPGITAVADLLPLDFIPVRWERFDFLISKERFFDRGVQLFLGLLHEKAFLELVEGWEGYDLTLSGSMVFPQEPAGQIGVVEK